MYYPILEVLHNFYKAYYKFMMRMIFWRTFNYNRQVNYADKNGYIFAKKTVGTGKAFNMWWHDISIQQVNNKEILFDKIDFILAWFRLALILIFALVILYYRIITVI